MTVGARRGLYRASAILITVGLAAFVVLLVGVLTHTGFQRLDTPVEHWFDDLRSRDVTTFMIVIALVFGPVGMPIIVVIVTVVWLLAASHAWRPLVLAVGMATGVILAQVIAPLVKHPRPPIGLMLAGPDHSYSFPSGHVLGASDFFVILAFLLASRKQNRGFTIGAFTVAVLMILLQVFSRLYLGYHYISDTTASMSLSAVILGVVVAIDTRRTARISGESVRGADSQLQRDGT